MLSIGHTEGVRDEGILLGDSPDPMGVTIKDQNQTEDVHDLIGIANSDVVRLTGFEYIELTLDKEVSVTLSRLVTRVSDLCVLRKGVKVFVLWIPRTYKSVQERVGLGYHMKDILNRFDREELPCRLDVLDSPWAESWYT